MKHKKHRIFTDFGNGMVSKILSYFDEMESKMLIYKGAEFLGHSSRKNLEKSWQHC
jgi:hypothetical protein